MEENKIYFIDYSMDIPVVHLFLSDGSDLFAIIDSGSEVTLFDKKYAEEHLACLKPYSMNDKINMAGLSGNVDVNIMYLDTAVFPTYDYETAEKGEIPVKKAFIHDLTQLKNAIKDIDVSMVIGSDILSKLKAKLNYKERMMTW